MMMSRFPDAAENPSKLGQVISRFREVADPTRADSLCYGLVAGRDTSAAPSLT